MKNKAPKYIIPKIAQKHWNKIGFEKRIGTAVALFSLKSFKELDFGIGDFGSLKEFIDFCKNHAMDIIQLLPINETSPHDDSPFGSISAFAINPLFMDIQQLFEEEGCGDVVEVLKRDPMMYELYKKIKDKDRVDYHDTRTVKRYLMEYAYKHFQKMENIDRYNEYKKYFSKNKFWLEGYSLFKFIKEREDWRAIYDWPKNWQKYSDKLHILFEQEHIKEIRFHTYVQWMLYKQSKAVHDYAKQCDVLIKGDIPLLVSKESADVWEYPQYFKTKLNAGAPPDYYSEEGQNWGLPLYNWAKHKADGYTWWKKRLAYQQNFFDLYRIDHVLGLFRIWSIPDGKSGKEGEYVPSNEKQWKNHGTNLLKMMLENSTMLPIAEDLGTVPKMVRQTLEDLGIPGYKVMIMEQKIPPQVFSPISLLATSTHDSPTLQGQWENMHIDEKKNFCFSTAINIEDHQSFDDESHETILRKLMLGTSSMFIILPLHDIIGKIPGVIGDNPAEERINTPGTMGTHNWSYRFPKLTDKKVDKKLKTYAAIVKEAKAQCHSWYSAKTSKKNTTTIELEDLQTNNQIDLKANKNAHIISPNGGMARIINTLDNGEVKITDIPFIQSKAKTFSLTIPAPNVEKQLKVTFFWRVDPNTYEWEGKDYTLNYKVKGQGGLPFQTTEY